MPKLQRTPEEIYAVKRPYPEAGRASHERGRLPGFQHEGGLPARSKVTPPTLYSYYQGQGQSFTSAFSLKGSPASTI
ncbi:MAG: hypothetical protein MZV70_42360 [Desulfobacterales bacterium]|nr:hypothetical protein [Desulfobacterales bacterium]